MTWIGPSFFILGLVVASAARNETSTLGLNNTSSMSPSGNTTPGDDNTTMSFAVPPSNTMNTKTVSISSTIGSMDTTTINSTFTPLTKGDERKTTKNIPVSAVTTKPVAPTRIPTTKAKETVMDKTTTAKPQVASSDTTGIIILVVIILVALGCGVACYFSRKRGRRYSVDFASRPDETNIPLSAVEPEVPADTVSQNGLQTFADTPTKEPEEPEEKPEAQEEQEQTSEADKSKVEADPIAVSAAPAPSSATSEDKPKEDVVEQSSPAPVEPNVEEKTDDEGAVSNKTSVESLKETNENNSNNADISQQRDLMSSNLFWDVPLDSPV